LANIVETLFRTMVYRCAAHYVADNNIEKCSTNPATVCWCG